MRVNFLCSHPESSYDFDSHGNINQMAEPQNVQDTAAPTNLRSVDPGWKYGTLPDPSKKMKVQCIFCKHVSNGGIFRFKQHLACRRGDVDPCPNVPPEVKEEICDYLNKIKAKKDKRKQDEDEDRADVRKSFAPNEEDVVVLSGTVPKKAKVFGQLDKFLMRDPEVVVDERKKANQLTITEKMKKEHRKKAIQYVARWFYQAGIAFNTANLKSFNVMLEAIGQFGPDLRGPTPYELREPLLKIEVEETQKGLEDHRNEWRKSGCSIMTDAWTDRRHRSIMNLCVNCKKGTSFLDAIDASADIHDAEFIFNLVDRTIEEVGEENVVQVVTDNAAANLAAGKLLKDKRPSIFWTPCAAHCIDLMCEAIGDIHRVKSTIQKARKLTIFIYSHHQTLSLMRKHTKGADLVRPGTTRFATAFLSLQSIHAHRSELRAMFCSSEWEQSKYSNAGEGWKLANMVRNPPFWNSVAFALNIFRPLSKVLRLVDSEKKPAMGFIFSAMLTLKKEISDVLQGDPSFCKKVLDIIDEKWDKRLHRPLHVAGYYLNPYFYWSDSEINTRDGVMSGLMECIDVFFPDTQIQDKIVLDVELPAYRDGTGAFGKPSAIRQRSDPDLDPVEWWTNHGYGTPHLQRMALRILNLTCTSSGCERNWSTFEMIHTKKRNRLDVQRLKNLVYVQFNAKLKDKRERHAARKDPLEVADRDRAKDWFVELNAEEDEIYPGAGVTWGQVAEASGVAAVDQNRRSTRTRQQNSQAQPTPSTQRERETRTQAAISEDARDEDDYEYDNEFHDEEEEEELANVVDIDGSSSECGGEEIEYNEEED